MEASAIVAPQEGEDTGKNQGIEVQKVEGRVVIRAMVVSRSGVADGLPETEESQCIWFKRIAQMFCFGARGPTGNAVWYLFFLLGPVQLHREIWLLRQEICTYVKELDSSPCLSKATMLWFNVKGVVVLLNTNSVCSIQNEPVIQRGRVD